MRRTTVTLYMHRVSTQPQARTRASAMQGTIRQTMLGRVLISTNVKQQIFVRKVMRFAITHSEATIVGVLKDTSSLLILTHLLRLALNIALTLMNAM